MKEYFIVVDNTPLFLYNQLNQNNLVFVNYD